MSANEYYTPSGNPGTGSSGASQPMRAEFSSIQTGFGKLPNLSGNGGYPVRVNASGSGLEAVTVATMAAALGVTGVLNAPSGTVMLFQQSSAPTGWTKLTTNNDCALRVVSGTAGTGGSYAFSTVFAVINTATHAITQAELPNVNFTVTDPGHQHNIGFGYTGGVTGGSSNPAVLVETNYTSSATTGITVSSGGSGTGHLHSLDLSVKYVDCIACQKQ